MDQPQAKETTCKHCDEVFPSKGKYQSHYRRVHQIEIEISRSNQDQALIYRTEDEKFVCVCGKDYYVRQSLYRHQKSCQQWKDHESYHDPDSDAEISIHGNFLLYSILFNL